MKKLNNLKLLRFGMKENGGAIRGQSHSETWSFSKKILCFLDTKRTMLTPGTGVVVVKAMFMTLMIRKDIFGSISNGISRLF